MRHDRYLYPIRSEAALRQGECLLRDWLPGGTLNGDEYDVRNPRRADDDCTGNFRINVRTGEWSDFAMDGIKGSDLVSLFAYLRGDIRQLDAAKQVARQVGHPAYQGKNGKLIDVAGLLNRKKTGEKAEQPGEAAKGNKQKDYWADWRIVMPVPGIAPAPPTRHVGWKGQPSLGEPNNVWPYRDADGNVNFYIYMFAKPDGDKDPRPLSLWVREDGMLKWRRKGPEKDRTLFGLDELYAKPDAPVLVVEGEKCANAAKELLPDLASVTSSFGSGSANKSDWSVLEGREVTIWPDKDKPGEGYAAAVAKLARAAGATTIRLVDWNDTPTERVSSLEPGMDVADLEGAGWSPQQIAAMVDVARAAPDTGPAALAKQEERIPQDPESVTVQFRVSDETRAMLVFENIPDLTTPHPKDRHPTVVESHVAERLAPLLRNKLARCEASQAWHYFDAISGYWHPLDNDEAIYAVVEALMAAGLSEIGYSKSKKNGAVDLLERKLALPKKRETGWLPFKGKLLNVATGQLVKTTPDTALRWVLPYHYEPDATCPAIDQWLLSVTGNDETMVHYLLCWLAAILRGVQLQKYLHLIGPSRTGKGLFMRLAKELVGAENSATTTFERMAGRFEAAGYFDKRLLMLPDTKTFKKGTEPFKTLLGDDGVTVEDKFKKPRNSKFRGLCIVASNESIAFSDHSDAIYRRRCVVTFDRVVSDSEIAAFHDAGGEEKLFSEIPGLANRLLKISEAEIRKTLTTPPSAIVEANREEEQAANPISRWVFENLIPCPQSEVMLGVFATHTLTTGDQVKKSKKIIEHASDRAFPSFIRWCSENELTERINPQAFSRGVIDAARTFEHRIEQKKTMTGRKLVGVRLRTDHDDDPDLVWFGEKRVAESPWLNSLNEGLPQGGEAQNEATAEPVEATTPDEATTNESSEEPEIEVVDLLAKRITDPLAKQVWSYIRLTGPGGITVSDLRERMNTQAEKVMPAVLELERLRLARVTETGKRVVRWTP